MKQVIPLQKNYNVLLPELDQEDVNKCEVSLIDAMLGGGLNHTNKWYKTNHNDTINGFDGKAWKQEVEKEHK